MDKEEKLSELDAMMKVQWKTAQYFQEALAQFAPNMTHPKGAADLLDRTCQVARGLAAVVDVWKFLRDERDMLEGETPEGTVTALKG